jgi:hypothetical protein
MGSELFKASPMNRLGRKPTLHARHDATVSRTIPEKYIGPRPDVSVRVWLGVQDAGEAGLSPSGEAAQSRILPYTVHGLSFAKYHQDPRWQAYLRKVGFAPERLARVEMHAKPPNASPEAPVGRPGRSQQPGHWVFERSVAACVTGHAFPAMWRDPESLSAADTTQDSHSGKPCCMAFEDINITKRMRVITVVFAIRYMASRLRPIPISVACHLCSSSQENHSWDEVDCHFNKLNAGKSVESVGRCQVLVIDSVV